MLNVANTTITQIIKEVLQDFVPADSSAIITESLEFAQDLLNIPYFPVPPEKVLQIDDYKVEMTSNEEFLLTKVVDGKTFYVVVTDNDYDYSDEDILVAFTGYEEAVNIQKHRLKSDFDILLLGTFDYPAETLETMRFLLGDDCKAHELFYGKLSVFFSVEVSNIKLDTSYIIKELEVYNETYNVVYIPPHEEYVLAVKDEQVEDFLSNKNVDIWRLEESTNKISLTHKVNALEMKQLIVSDLQYLKQTRNPK